MEAKLRKQITLFTVFKFVGLGVLVLGGLLFLLDMITYVQDLMYAMSYGNQEQVAEAFIIFIVEGSVSMFVLMVGLALLIVFSVLRKKRKQALVQLNKTTVTIEE